MNPFKWIIIAFVIMAMIFALSFGAAIILTNEVKKEPVKKAVDLIKREEGGT